MSVNSTDAFSGPYTATGAAQIFPFIFVAASRDEVQVTANGIEVDPTTYSVTLNSDGTGAINATLPAGAEVFVESNPDFAQSAQFARFAPYFPDAINVHLDRAAIRDIALQDRVNRTFVIPRRYQDAAGKYPAIDNNGNWTLVDGIPGIPGAAANTRKNLAELKAANIIDVTSLYDNSVWYWTLGNFSTTPAADIDVNVVKANSTPLTTGAWVRQRATGVLTQIGSGAPNRNVEDVLRARAVNVRDEGAAMDGVTDDSDAFRRALSRGREVVIPGRMYINQEVILPDLFKLSGFGSQRSVIVFGPNGKVRCEGPGFSNPNDTSSLQKYGRAVCRDLGFALADNAPTLTVPNFNMWKVEHITFTGCLFYQIWLNLDNHNYLTFRKCEFYGGKGAFFKSQCTFQPLSKQWISALTAIEDCHFSGCPIELIDTVEYRMHHTAVFGGAYGLYSHRVNAIGSNDMPFYLGPVISGCTFDSIDGIGIDIDYGGTNCRITGNFVSCGRGTAMPGIRLTNCYGMEVYGNHVEWCGQHGLRLANCSGLSIIGNTFLNQAAGDGILATGTTGCIVIGNTFENKPLWGGSGNGNTQLAIETPASDFTSSVVTGNRVSGMLNAFGIYIEGSATRVFANPGAPIGSERNWAPAKSGGWTAGTGAGYRAAWTSYAGQTHGAAYSQPAVQALDDAARIASQRLLAIEVALRENGIIN